MKQLFILLCLFSAIGGQAQGCLKGTVTDAKTGEELPFVNVTVFHDGKQVHGGSTDFDGIFTIKPLPADQYEVVVNAVGYQPYKKEGVRVKAMGFTLVNIKLTPTASCREADSLAEIYLGNVTQEPKEVPLPEYEVMDSGLAMLLDRVIEGKENTYFWREEPLPPKPSPEGTTFNLFIVSPYLIDTSDHTGFFYQQYLFNPSLPRPLNETAPQFSFDSINTSVEIIPTYDQQYFTEAAGYVEYRGRIFFIYYSVTDLTYLRATGKQRPFLQMVQKEQVIGIWDPPIWDYTFQQGHWYRWMEYPNGW